MPRTGRFNRWPPIEPRNGASKAKTPPSEAISQYPVPDWLTVIHVAGFPLERHLSGRLARRGFRRLAPLGPNDGAGIVLADLCRLPGLIYPVWGADHYLRPEWDIAGLFARLVAYRDLAGIRHEASVAFARR